MFSLQQQISANNFDHLIKQHPCFNQCAQKVHGRVHIPVSPECNIRCRFCNRQFNSNEDRPGVSRDVITPQAAAEIVDRALLMCPEITVVGVAGPGESLATPHAIEALSLIHKKHPELIGCLSTNGLRLAQNVEQIVKSGVRTVTVTINAVDPAILTGICDAVVDDNVYLTGLPAAQTLISAQIKGLKKAAEAGLAVKINTVLIPGVNDEHIGEIAAIAAANGAIMMNIIPLIPQHKLSHIPAPNCDQLNRARKSAEQHLPVFRHCKHCRADACGVPGINDFSDQLYSDQMETFSHG